MVKDAGLSGRRFHLHALRHCYGYILADAGVPVDYISKLYNHSSTELAYLTNLLERVRKLI